MSGGNRVGELTIVEEGSDDFAVFGQDTVAEPVIVPPEPKPSRTGALKEKLYQLYYFGNGTVHRPVAYTEAELEEAYAMNLAFDERKELLSMINKALMRDCVKSLDRGAFHQFKLAKDAEREADTLAKHIEPAPENKPTRRL